MGYHICFRSCRTRSIVSGELLPCICQAFTNSTRDDDFRETQLLEEDIPFIQDELDNVTTIMYLLIEGVRDDVGHLKSAWAKICKG
jgi:hypothetical protein